MIKDVIFLDIGTELNLEKEGTRGWGNGSVYKVLLFLVPGSVEKHVWPGGSALGEWRQVAPRTCLGPSKLQAQRNILSKGTAVECRRVESLNVNLSTHEFMYGHMHTHMPQKQHRRQM